MKTLPAILLLSIAVSPAAELYSTDFEAFTAGDNRWAGTDGWISNDTSSGAQAIDQDLIIGGGLGKTASLGFNQPASTFTFVARSIGHDAGTTGIPIVEIDTLLGIEDSTNGRRDDFYLSVYNVAGNRLASIRFDNQDPTAAGTQYGIWREDGLYQFDTLVNFIHGELFNLYVSINLEENTWTADVDGLPLFTNAPFTATSSDRNFGLVAFEWDLTSSLITGFGDNFLLVADLAVRSVPVGVEPFSSLLTRSANGDCTVAWQADPGFTYRVEYSESLAEWIADLPGSEFVAGSVPQTIQYTDSSAGKGVQRFYRVLRNETP